MAAKTQMQMGHAASAKTLSRQQPSADYLQAHNLDLLDEATK